MKRFRKTMGMLLAVIMISMTMFSGTIAHAAGTMAFSVGTDYGGLFGVDTTSDATNASDFKRNCKKLYRDIHFYCYGSIDIPGNMSLALFVCHADKRI